MKRIRVTISDLMYDQRSRSIPASGTESGGRILDFGAGKGELISLLAHMDGMELHGADIMKRPENIPACLNWYQWDLNDALVRAQPKRVLRHPLRCAIVLECRLRAGSSW